MSKLPQHQDEQEQEIDPLEELGIDDGDYGFVISAEGELKHLFTPEGFALYPPKAVQRILKIFGIKDINAVGMDDGEDATIH
jgi:hypothetical protein